MLAVPAAPALAAGTGGCVVRWLRGPARMRIIGSAYHPANDADCAITVGAWNGAFDAVLHLDRVTSSRLLAAAPGPP